MWKTLFGNKKSNAELEKIKLQSRDKNNKIYPILKPGDWAGLAAGALRKTLVGDAQNPQVVIGYGYDTEDNFIFLTQKHLEKMSVDEITEEAYENLANYEVAIKEVFPNKVIVIDGKDFCSEKILDKTFMLTIHEKFNSEHLIVSIPRRRGMMITANLNDEEIQEQFIKVHNDTWNDPSYGNAPITNHLFIVTNGEITNILEL